MTPGAPGIAAAGVFGATRSPGGRSAVLGNACVGTGLAARGTGLLLGEHGHEHTRAREERDDLRGPDSPCGIPLEAGPQRRVGATVVAGER